LDDDDDSDLSEVDEAQFQDFNVNEIAIDEDEDQVPTTIDEDTVKLIGRHKRKRGEGAGGRESDEDAGDGEYGGERRRRKKDGKKSRRRRTPAEGEDDGTDQQAGKRRKKKDTTGDDGETQTVPRQRRIRAASPEDEESLDPAERKSCASPFVCDMHVFALLWLVTESNHGFSALAMRASPRLKQISIVKKFR
jgi:transcription factor SPN1